MQSRLDEFRARRAQIVVVTFVQPGRLAQYLQVRPWPFRVLADPERAAYRAFGLESASWLRILRPQVILKYLALILRGWLPRPAHEDVHQLGGDFVLDTSGRIIYSYRSHDPTDRPSVDELIQAVAKSSEAELGEVRGQLEQTP